MLFERLWVNGMVFSDVQRGLILLNAIPKEWSTVTQIYSQANQTLETTTFIGVQDAIMAEYEQISRPSTIATHHISVVKCKGKSPTFTEQTQTTVAQKTAPMFAYYIKTYVLLNADII